MKSPDFPRGFPIDAQQLHYLIKHDFVAPLDLDSMDISERNSVDSLSRQVFNVPLAITAQLIPVPIKSDNGSANLLVFRRYNPERLYWPLNDNIGINNVIVCINHVCYISSMVSQTFYHPAPFHFYQKLEDDTEYPRVFPSQRK